ncbi:ABC transporter ATP-binding protein [Fulvivirga lutimaris]|uniref:ABC transporter ATP-binding protein n=1 Tax=Fulvivirga lutimaris TaxID=1819566 RepID=UPI0012BD332B|nr:ABC transporter ATP-binding protein [Fulvivirga lutimaris]MTI38281.1 ABC transporter ATP-binding protein [Fulvivirga lutimaris]
MIAKLTGYIKGYFNYFFYFLEKLRHRLIISLLLSISVGALDGLGLAMFLPILKMAGETTSQEEVAEEMGNLDFIILGMNDLGIPFTLPSILLVMLMFFLLKGAIRFYEGYYKMKMQRYFMKMLRFQNVDALNNYAYQYFVKADVGRIQNTLSGEVTRILTAYKSYASVIQSLIMVIVYLVLAFLSNPQFALTVIVGGGLMNIFYRKIYSKTKKSSNKIVAENSDFQANLIQMVAFFKYFKATGTSKIFSDKLKQIAENIERTSMKMGWYSVLIGSTREPLIVMVVVGVILFQTQVVGQGLALIILSLMFFYRSLTYFMNLQTQWNSFLTVSGSLDQMELFNQELYSHRDQYGNKPQYSLKQALILDNVSFGYAKGSYILKRISLNIPKNKSIALVGESGSGKTTLVNILAGLLPLSEGTYYVDSLKSSELYWPDFQRKIGYITQEPVIFDDDIFNNITFWAERTEENLKKFWEVLERAAVADFTRDLPDKEYTRLGSNGVLISGGQKQRLSIARELFKDVDILIMDEATSALDSETELQIQQNIDALKGQYTLIIIAHRLATIKNVDEVILLDKGKIEASGSYQELKERSQVFEKMVNLQEV